MKVNFNYINIDIIFHYKLTICIQLLCDPRGPPQVGRPPPACPPSGPVAGTLSSQWVSYVHCSAIPKSELLHIVTCRNDYMLCKSMMQKEN